MRKSAVASVVSALFIVVLAAALPSASVLAEETGPSDFETQQKIDGFRVRTIEGGALHTVGARVLSQWGRARRRAGHGPIAQGRGFRGITGGRAGSGEGGLLGIALSPNYERDRFAYAYYTTATDNRVVRFRLDNVDALVPVVTGIPRGNTHDGGRISFGPDGLLYVATGDAGNTSNSQNQDSLRGKILRVTPDGAVPADNPFSGSRVFSLGHRNVQGLAWDAAGRLFATELGQKTSDEVNRVRSGGNYGWPIVEGNSDNPDYLNPGAKPV